MTGHESDSLYLVYFADLFQKFRESILRIIIYSLAFFQEINTVGIYILSKQHNLFIALISKTFYFSKHIFRSPASLSSSYIRNDTVSAEIIAAVHDIYAGLEIIFLLLRKHLNVSRGRFKNINHLSVGLSKTKEKQLRQLIQIKSTKYNIHEAEALFDILNDISLLHHTAADSHQHIRTLLFLFFKRT